jgi:hypothetical protein
MVDAPESRSAGNSPNNRVASMAIRSVKAATHPSMPTRSMRSAAGTRGVMTRSNTTASTSPAAAPNPASSALSVSSCRASRTRVAPSAERTVSSPILAVPRARIPLARLVHAASRKTADAASSSSRGRWIPPVWASWSPVSTEPVASKSGSYCVFNVARMLSRSRSAVCGVIPAVRRPTVSQLCEVRDTLCSISSIGHQIWVRSGKSNPGGSTPTTWRSQESLSRTSSSDGGDPSASRQNS